MGKEIIEQGLDTFNQNQTNIQCLKAKMWVS